MEFLVISTFLSRVSVEQVMRIGELGVQHYAESLIEPWLTPEIVASGTNNNHFGRAMWARKSQEDY
ncbi:hypothetical protein AG1IA_05180 [Rhizoctonia solani AG-1 IA]|uniref:Uncharacterized protein n=1 Tax=Thanatephorus cucumeris (strain AG1-IA) TaxID=983506 RepID=L8WS58_THACA|nr:hypothetical protein AG1IA_05180 [Rhizoctonia solani AG-1 IA]